MALLQNSLTIQDVAVTTSSSLLWNATRIFFATEPNFPRLRLRPFPMTDNALSFWPEALTTDSKLNSRQRLHHWLGVGVIRIEAFFFAPCPQPEADFSSGAEASNDQASSASCPIPPGAFMPLSLHIQRKKGGT
jgi:hypothetical protein